MTDTNLPVYALPDEDQIKSVPSIPTGLYHCSTTAHNGNLAGFDGLTATVSQYPTNHQQGGFGESSSNDLRQLQGHTQRRAGRTVSLACNNCRTNHKQCSSGDPCKPCIRKGIADSCRRHGKKTRARRTKQVAQTTRGIPPPDHAVLPTSSTQHVTQPAQMQQQPNAYVTFAWGCDTLHHSGSAPAEAPDYPMGSNQSNVYAQDYPEVTGHLSGAANFHIGATNARFGPLNAAGFYGGVSGKEGWEVPAYDQGMGAFYADGSRDASHFHPYK